MPTKEQLITAFVRLGATVVSNGAHGAVIACQSRRQLSTILRMATHGGHRAQGRYCDAWITWK